MGCGSSKNGGNPTNVTPSMPSENSNSSDVVQDEEIRRLRDMRNDIVFNAAPDQLVKDKNEGGQKIIVDSIVIPALKKNKFLKDLLTETEMQMFADYADEFHFETNEVVIKEGDEKDMYFYVVAEGKLKYTKSGKDEGVCEKGESFGELALLSNSPRNASVTTIKPCKLYGVDRDTFRYIMKEATIHQTEVIMDLLKDVAILKDLDESQIEDVAAAVIPKDFRAGEVIFSEGDQGNIFYMIQSGSVVVKQAAAGMNDVKLGPRQYFGEKALETGEVRNATLECLEPCKLLLLSREDFDKVVGSMKEIIDANHNERIMNSVEFFSTLNPADRAALASRMEEKIYRKGYTILDENKEDTKFYIIKSGCVNMTSKGATGEIQELAAGDYFNIQTLLKSDGQEHVWPTCIAKEEVTCFLLDREDLRQVTGVETLANDAYKERMNMIASAKLKRIPFKELKKISALGQGSFGRVYLVQDKNCEVFALKALHKKEIVHYQQQDCVINEKNVMMMCHHPFILQLHNTYRDKHKLYFLLEFCNGGELFTRIHTSTRDGVSEPGHAKFYVGCVAQALSYMLDRSIMYRDLKPENMLIDEDGYIKIIDFGFAKKLTSTGKKKRTKKTNTQCGTPEYMAPEIVLNRGYDISVDWWALGVLLFECLAGHSPFAAQSGNKIMQNIVERNFEFPKKNPMFDRDAKDLISGLLSKKPKDRLMMGPTRAAPVLKHPWFNDVDWRKLNGRSLPAPWKPHATSSTDIRCFLDPATNKAPQLDDKVDKKWVDAMPGWDKDFGQEV